MIAIVDTGGANLSSVLYALERLGKPAEVTAEAERIRAASHVILPGVGAARDSMSRIQRAGLVDTLKGLQVPVLGICLGMQLLFQSSEEGDADCLGIIPGRVTKLPVDRGLSVPHMGWNRVAVTADAAPLFSGIAGDSHFYFVHSFVAPMGPWVVGRFGYGGDYPAAVAQGNYFGVQFHPERSAVAGSRLLGNFVSL